jgi:hypothetical protein
VGVLPCPLKPHPAGPLRAPERYGSAAFTEASKRNSIFGAGVHPGPANGTRGFRHKTASLAVLVLLVGLTFTSRDPAALEEPPRVPQDERSRSATGDPMADFSARWRPLHRPSVSAVFRGILQWKAHHLGTRAGAIASRRLLAIREPSLFGSPSGGPRG